MAEAVELPVTVLERERDCTFRGGAAAADLGNVKLDAARNVDAHTVVLAGCRALDRAARGFEHTGYGSRRLACVDVDLETDRPVDRRMMGIRHGAEDPPVIGSLLGLAAVQDSIQRLALFRIRTLVDDDLHLTLAFEDRSGPGVDDRRAQPIELQAVEMAFLDLQNLKASASALGRQAFELAWAAVVAIAVAESFANDQPIDPCHGLPPSRVIDGQR